MTDLEHTVSSVGGSADRWTLDSEIAAPSTRLVPYSSFTMLRFLGAGEFAQVYADVMDGKPVCPPRTPTPQPVLPAVLS